MGLNTSHIRINMKVLVTGGFGTIGSYLSSKLFKSGHQVTIFDNEEIGKLDNLLLYLTQDELKEINLIFSDILDHDSLSAAIKEVDICFHMAATLGTLNVVQQPSRMLNVNIIGTQNVVMECVKNDIPVVLASTSMVYGNNPKAKVSETDDLFIGGNVDVRLWWYAISKLADECFGKSVVVEHPNSRVLMVRPFNVIAPVQNEAVGFVFPRFFSAAMTNQPLLVYGDGKQKRTFTWVTDFVDCVLDLVSKDAWNQTVNIGGTDEIEIL